MSWTLIESQTLGSSAASVTLGNGGTIPQTYKTLRLVISSRSNTQSGVAGVYIAPNNNTSNRAYRALEGSGSAATSGTGTVVVAGLQPGTSYTASTFGSCSIDIPNYAGSTNKPFSTDSVTENNATASYQGMYASLWSDTTAITSLVVSGDGSFAANSTFTLYGLK